VQLLSLPEQAHGRDWARLQESVPGKTLTQIKNFYQNYKVKVGCLLCELLYRPGLPMQAKQVACCRATCGMMLAKRMLRERYAFVSWHPVWRRYA
jgi:hypothetical protein